jgi:1,4-dihydroxy-2-naphthoate octaprenyltransferase
MNARQFFDIVEMRTKLIGMVTFLCGSSYAYFSTGSWSWKIGLLMGFAVLCVDMGTTGFNTYFDFVNGTDRPGQNKERDKVLVHEQVSPFLALSVSLALYFVSGLLGLALAWLVGWVLIPVGTVCMLVGFAYTGGPHPISRTPFGELFAGGFLGTVLFLLSCYVQTGEVGLGTFAASLPHLILVAMILSANNTCDLANDRLAGRRTLSILLGAKHAPFLLFAELGCTFLLSVGLSVAGIYPRSGLVLFPLFLLVSSAWMRTLARNGFSPRTKSSTMPVVARIYLAFGIFFVLSLAVDSIR